MSSSVVGDEAVRSRGVGARDWELDELRRIAAWKRAPKSERRVILTCVMFLTRIPCPGWCDHHPGFLVLALAWFPSVGALIGLWAGSVYDSMRVFIKTPAVCSVASLMATEFLTMCFHDDGLADAADAIAGGWSRKEIFTILKDSRIGTFGTVALIIFLTVKVELVSALGRDVSRWQLFESYGAAPALLVAHSMARATAAPLMYVYPYVLDEDDAKGEFYAWLGRSSRELLSWKRVLFSSASAFAIAVLTFGTHTAVVIGAATVFVCVVAGKYADKALGGVQGDYLGATICVCEVILYCLLLACEQNGVTQCRLPSDILARESLRPLLLLLVLVVGLFKGIRVLL